jgi:hypothetical protein
MKTAFDPTFKDMQPKWYGPATVTLREEAAKAGADARGFQDVGWAGLKALRRGQGQEVRIRRPMINQINAQSRPRTGSRDTAR